MSLTRPSRRLLSQWHRLIPSSSAAARHQPWHRCTASHPQRQQQQQQHRSLHSSAKRRDDQSPQPPAAGPSNGDRKPASRRRNDPRRHTADAKKRAVPLEQLVDDPDAFRAFVAEKFPAYTEQEMAELRQAYTPAQMRAIERGEAAIDPMDLALRGHLRGDNKNIDYLDDMALVRRVVDLKPPVDIDPATVERIKWPTPHEFAAEYLDRLTQVAERQLESSLSRSLARALRQVRDTEGNTIDVTEDELCDLESNPVARRRMMSKADTENLGSEHRRSASDMSIEQAEKLSDAIDEAFWRDVETTFETTNPLLESPIDLLREHEQIDGLVDARTSAMAADVGPIPGYEADYEIWAKHAGTNGPASYRAILAQQIHERTGVSERTALSLFIKDIDSEWVARQTRLGKVRSVRVTAIAGNCDGWLGHGIATSTETATAMTTAKLLAVRHMKRIPRYENRTIYGRVRSKVSGTVMEMVNRPPGFGLRVPPRLYDIFRAVGIHDLTVRVIRGQNPMNMIQAVMKGLMTQPDPDEIARARGVKLVDVRKVYYGGTVY